MAIGSTPWSRAAWRRGPGCPWTWTSSPRRADHAAVQVRLGEGLVRRHPGGRRHTSRGAGRPGRCRRPARRSWCRAGPSAIAVHSMCQPGRPGPSGESQPGSPSRLSRQTRQSSGSFLPGSVRVAAALGEDRPGLGLGEVGQRAELGVAGLGEVEVGELRVVDGVDRLPVLQTLDQLGDQRDRLHGADVVLAAAARSARPCRRGTAGSAARRARASRPRSRPPAPAAGRRCR